MNASMTQEVNNAVAQAHIPSVTIPDNQIATFSTATKHDVNVAPSTAQSFTLSKLVQDRKLWEKSVYLTSNQKLYGILAQCYAYYHAMGKSDDTAKSLREELKKFCNESGIKCQSGTHGIVKVVKAVFFDDAMSVDRRRISTYSLALRCALDNKISVADLAVFIEQNGGVQELRRFKTTKSLSLSDRSERARLALETSTPIAMFKNDAISQSIDASDYDQPLVAVLIKRADGQIEIHGVVKNKSAINASLATLFPSKSSV